MAKSNQQSDNTTPMNRLITCLSGLPGIGKRSAERIAFHLLKASKKKSGDLAAAIRDLKANTRQCSVCFNLTDDDPCAICGDPKRNPEQVLVVEQPHDVASIESIGLYRGLYHVLMGRLAPLDGVGPDELTVEALIDRIKQKEVSEVIIGTNPTFEGDGTALYLAKRLAQTNVSVSRLARGLPHGVDLELASKASLADALEGRRKV
jgi:recombination protein RecR